MFFPAIKKLRLDGVLLYFGALLLGTTGGLLAQRAGLGTSADSFPRSAAEAVPAFCLGVALTLVVLGTLHAFAVGAPCWSPGIQVVCASFAVSLGGWTSRSAASVPMGWVLGVWTGSLMWSGMRAVWQRRAEVSAGVVQLTVLSGCGLAMGILLALPMAWWVGDRYGAALRFFVVPVALFILVGQCVVDPPKPLRGWRDSAVHRVSQALGSLFRPKATLYPVLCEAVALFCIFLITSASMLGWHRHMRLPAASLSWLLAPLVAIAASCGAACTANRAPRSLAMGAHVGALLTAGAAFALLAATGVWVGWRFVGVMCLSLCAGFLGMLLLRGRLARLRVGGPYAVASAAWGVGTVVVGVAAALGAGVGSLLTPVAAVGVVVAMLLVSFVAGIVLHPARAVADARRAAQFGGSLVARSINERSPVAVRVVVSARRFPRRVVFEENEKTTLYGRFLEAAIVLAHRLDGPLYGVERVGMRTPETGAGILAMLAVTLRGQVPVLMNAKPSELNAWCLRLGIRRLLTLDGEVACSGNVRCVSVGATLRGAGRMDSVRAAVRFRFLPGRLGIRGKGFDVDYPCFGVCCREPSGPQDVEFVSHSDVLGGVEHVLQARELNENRDYAALVVSSLWSPLLAAGRVEFSSHGVLSR